MTANYLFCAYIRDIITIINRVNNISINDYVDLSNNAWMIYSYTHPHTGDDMFDVGSIATEHDVFIELVKRTLATCMIEITGNVPFECSIDGIVAVIRQKYKNKPFEFIENMCEYLLSLKTISCYDWN